VHAICGPDEKAVSRNGPLSLSLFFNQKSSPFERIEGRSTKVVLIGCGHPDLIEPYSSKSVLISSTHK